VYVAVCLPAFAPGHRAPGRVSVPNIGEPVFDEPREVDGFRARRARLGRQLGTERLGVSLWEVEPGSARTRTTSTSTRRSWW
jgi:uncharacterized cupin superfamily protein